MITIEELTKLLKSPESSTLDFKEELYDFQNDKDNVTTAKFVKDVISFSNTIRTETSYMIFGVKENSDKSIELKGIDKSIDDSILQEKVKDKVFPRPNFLFYEIIFEDKRLGVLEFPITKYEIPITPAIKLKGLESGKVYFRNGTSNTEANAIDIIRINDWLKSLPGNLALTLNDKISDIMKRLTTGNEKLSTLISELFNIARIHNLKDLERFCIVQIQGVKNIKDGEHTYRTQKLSLSTYNLEIQPHQYIKVTEEVIRNELYKLGSLHDVNYQFNQNIIQIEDYLEQLENNRALGKIIVSSKLILEDKEDYPLAVYFFERNIKSLYSNIRQRIIDELMKY